MIALSTAGGERQIGDGKPVFFIAEIGKNFIQTADRRSTAEYLSNAIRLVRAAKAAGADAVKFQTHNVEDEQLDIKVTAPHFSGADRYTWLTWNTDATPFTEFWRPLKRFCDAEGIIFFTTPMSRGAADKVAPLDPALWKVGSGDLLDFVCLDRLRRSGKPIVLSTGMSTLEEIDRAVGFIREQTSEVAIMHCVSCYPCPPEALRLGTIGFLRERYGLVTGFSDHSIGYDSVLAAVALGASIVEKHFSFDRGLWGSDHKVSLTPEEFGAMVKTVREIESDPNRLEAVRAGEIARRGLAAGADKVLQEEEAVFRPFFRKTLTAGADLPAGTVLQPEHLYAMRPQSYALGLPSEAYPEVLGRRLCRSVRRYEPLTEAHFEPSVSVKTALTGNLEANKLCPHNASGHMKYSIGIMGTGMVGGSLERYFEARGVKPFIYDKGKNLGSIEEVNRADMIFVCVPTPFDENGGGFDLSYVRDALNAIQGDKIVVIKSTIVPGTTEALQTVYPNLKLAYNPEFLTELTADQDTSFPDRQIVGVTSQSYSVGADIMAQLPLAPFERIVPSTAAEMTKYYGNTWFSVKVVFANQMYDLCQKAGVDYDAVKECVSADKRIGRTHLEIFHKGYRGYGGKCLPKDTRALIQLGDRLGVELALLKKVEELNNRLVAQSELEKDR